MDLTLYHLCTEKQKECSTALNNFSIPEPPTHFYLHLFVSKTILNVNPSKRTVPLSWAASKWMKKLSSSWAGSRGSQKLVLVKFSSQGGRWHHQINLKDNTNWCLMKTNSTQMCDPWATAVRNSIISQYNQNSWCHVTMVIWVFAKQIKDIFPRLIRFLKHVRKISVSQILLYWKNTR